MYDLGYPNPWLYSVRHSLAKKLNYAFTTNSTCAVAQLWAWGALVMRMARVGLSMVKSANMRSNGSVIPERVAAERVSG